MARECLCVCVCVCVLLKFADKSCSNKRWGCGRVRACVLCVCVFPCCGLLDNVCFVNRWRECARAHAVTCQAPCVPKGEQSY